jgi:hypothetical protein
MSENKGLKYTFCILLFIVESILGLKMTDYEKKNVTLGWGQKSAEIVTYYLNGPNTVCLF